jgi:hypothetical protein
MIPLPQILSELIMALGGALLVGSVLALARSRARDGAAPSDGAAPAEEGARPVQARGRVLLNAFIGLIVFVWGFASFVTKLGGKA